MKKVLQNLVKIIIVGSFFDLVFSHRPFPSFPPYPYYHSDDYYAPSFAPPSPEPFSVFYSEQNIRPSIPFPQYYHSPPPLFPQDKNYHPPPVPAPGGTFPKPPFSILTPSFSIEISKKKLNPLRPKDKVKVHTSNVIHRHESYRPYYQDEFNKNYPEEDYSDIYSDESPPPLEPCGVNSPYQFFQPDPSNPLIKFPLCGPYFQPNLVNALYGLKTPITLLPSRFPPRIEQFIEKIQNYFSTYNYPDLLRPQNQTQTTSTTQAPITTSSASEAPVSLETTGQKKPIEENQETQTQNELTPQQMEVTTAVSEVTKKPEIVTSETQETQSKEISVTTEASIMMDNEQMDAQNTTEMSIVSVTTPAVNESEVVSNELSMNDTDTNVQQILPVETAKNNTTEEPPFVNEVDKSLEERPELSTQMVGAEITSTSTESAETENKTEDNNKITTTNEIFHQADANNG